MNNFRERLLGGGPPNSNLLRTKRPPRSTDGRPVEDESFAGIQIVREESRLANHRESDRHRLEDEQVDLLHDGRTQTVILVNLSGGGAMIEGAAGLKLWDQVQLQLADGHHVHAAVRWLRGSRLGLEFAQETCIESDADEVAAILRAVIARTFPDCAADQAILPTSTAEPGPEPPAVETSEDRIDLVDREQRHPLIWSGLIHYDQDSHRVRLRNISTGGALIECGFPLPVGAELLLDLEQAGTVFASVGWARGDAAGLRFHTPYDLRRLAASRPQVASSRWVAPDYLREVPQGANPWRGQWGEFDHGPLQRRAGSIRRC